MVGGREARQVHLAVAGRVDLPPGDLDDAVDRALAVGAVGEAGVAEAAAVGAAAGDLDRDPVMDDLEEGHDRGLGMEGGVEVGDDAPLHVPGERRREAAGHGGQRVDPVGPLHAARPARRLDEFGERLLAVAHADDVDERGERGGVGGDGPARDDDRVVVPAFGRAEGEPPGVEQGEEPGVVHLVLEAHPYDVERPERQPEVERGAESPLAQHASRSGPGRRRGRRARRGAR
jgi:hypothetical protein